MSITKENKQDIISKFAINKKDTGSAEIQIAIISERINNLTEHFKKHNHDNHSKKGLLGLVNKRKKFLSYLLKNKDAIVSLGRFDGYIFKPQKVFI